MLFTRQVIQCQEQEWFCLTDFKRQVELYLTVYKHQLYKIY